MIDLLFAEKNINKYKLDYEGYLVIVDRIRTIDILENDDLKKMQVHLKYLKNKYSDELSIIKKNEKDSSHLICNSKNSKAQVVEELKYIFNRLPAIGFIILGKEKEIGIQRYIKGTI